MDAVSQQRKGLKRYPFLPQAKKIQAESPVSGAKRSLREAQRKEMRPNKKSRNIIFQVRAVLRASG
ncbi:MAG: hypothetical protein LBK05_00920 [Treponema sp.]|jgi:hypothetical protein|nr:hypothetical protein [Treponema sp.]